MRIIDCEQGSASWFKARQGLPTASNFHKIITPAKLEYSKQAIQYAYKLLCEKLLNTTMDSVQGIEWIERGREMEPTAAQAFQLIYEVDTDPVGFVTTDDGKIGASPDRFVKGRNEGLEIKCPSPPVQLEYLLTGPGSDYRVQVQGQIWVCEFDKSYLFSYHPMMPPARIETGRDKDCIAKIEAALRQFNDQLYTLYARALTLGAFQAYEEAATPLERERAGELTQAIMDEHGIPP